LRQPAIDVRGGGGVWCEHRWLRKFGYESKKVICHDTFGTISCVILASIKKKLQHHIIHHIIQDGLCHADKN